jgi:hypothetical protein
MPVAKEIPQIATDLLEYNPDTGVVVWKKKPAKRILVGSVAGCKCDYKDTYYYNIKLQSKNYKLHRVIWFLYYGEQPPHNMEIDHIDRDGTNNKINNLRLVTPTQNQHNRGTHKNNTSGCPGVQYFYKKYRVRIQNKGVITNLGSYDTYEEAVTIYQQAKENVLQ